MLSDAKVFFFISASSFVQKAYVSKESTFNWFKNGSKYDHAPQPKKNKDTDCTAKLFFWMNLKISSDFYHK